MFYKNMGVLLYTIQFAVGIIVSNEISDIQGGVKCQIHI